MYICITVYMYPCLEHDQSTSEQVTSHDNDEEFTVESDSASEQQLSDSEGRPITL